MPVLWLSMILASPVVLVDSVSPEAAFRRRWAPR